MVANGERRFSSVRFLLYVLILLSAEKDFSIDDVVADTVNTSFNNFVNSGTVRIESFWYKKLRSSAGVLHSFLTVCEL